MPDTLTQDCLVATADAMTAMRLAGIIDAQIPANRIVWQWEASIEKSDLSKRVVVSPAGSITQDRLNHCVEYKVPLTVAFQCDSGGSRIGTNLAVNARDAVMVRLARVDRETFWSLASLHRIETIPGEAPDQGVLGSSESWYATLSINLILRYPIK